MNKLKLKDFLDIYNFRNYRENIPEYKRNDTNIIRIYFNEDIGRERFIEFGIYDWSETEYKRGIYKDFLNENILEQNVNSFSFDYDLETFVVFLGDSNE